MNHRSKLRGRKIWRLGSLSYSLSPFPLSSNLYSLSSFHPPTKTFRRDHLHFFMGNRRWLRESLYNIEPILKEIKLKFGPILTLKIGSHTTIIVGSHSLAHRALVENGAIFADRPHALPVMQLLSSNQHHISSAAYGPTWRLLRRNLTAEILHPSKVKSYSNARNLVLSILLRRLSSGDIVKVVDHFQYAMFCLLVLMCFGDKLEETQVKQIEKVQRDLLLNFGRFNLLNLFPKLGKIIFHRRWEELYQLRRNQMDVLIPLIKSRIDNSNKVQDQDNFVTSYVDTLSKLQLQEEGNRKLSLEEIVSLCSEFLNAGTDTTTSALQWIIANLVTHPEIQDKLYEEIVRISGPSPALSGDGKMAVVEEEDLQRMPYLKAVVFESLRVYPPGHFVVGHSVTEEVELDGYVIPKNADINFMVAEMGRDPEAWENPMEFKPERFLNDGEVFDITGSREIKMMPFGAGRRMCPGFNLALLHLEFFVANLTWYFEWKAPRDVPVDLSEKLEFTFVMKNPLLAEISPRG